VSNNTPSAYDLLKSQIIKNLTFYFGTKIEKMGQNLFFLYSGFPFPAGSVNLQLTTKSSAAKPLVHTRFDLQPAGPHPQPSYHSEG
jgi:hypothetical protein